MSWALDPDRLALLIALAIGLSVLTAVLAAGLAANREEARRARRLRGVVDRARGTAQAEAARPSTLLRARDNDRGLEKVLAALVPKPDAMRLRLARTGLALTLGRYAALVTVAALLAVAALWLFVGLPPTVAIPVGLGLGLIVPHMIVGSLIARRTSRFIAALPEGIDLIVRGLRAGLPVSDSVVAVGREAVEPVGGIFRAISDRVRVGESLEDAITETARTMDAPELKFLSIVLSIQRETGGNLAETLANLSDVLRRRRQMKLKVRAMSSEARASAYILGALPFVMFAIILMVNPGYVLQLLDDPRGHILLAIGLSSIALGIGVMAKMIRFEI